MREANSLLSMFPKRVVRRINMRKVIFQMLISLDGFFEGPNKEIDWQNVEGEFNKNSITDSKCMCYGGFEMIINV